MAKHMFSDVYNQHHFTLLWYIYIYLEKPTAEGWHGCHSKNCWLPLIQFCYCSPFLVCGVQLLFVFLKKENYSEQMSSSTQNLKGLFQIDCPPNYSCSLQDLQVFNLFSLALLVSPIIYCFHKSALIQYLLKLVLLSFFNFVYCCVFI